MGPVTKPSENGWVPMEPVDDGVDDAEPSPCPVCGVGPEQSSDPANMSRSVCYCGHPRFYDYKIREGHTTD